MKFFDIRDRVLMAALLPVTAVAFLVSAVFLLGRVGDLDEAHSQRARSLARQVASACEYGMFSGNTRSLQAVAAGALREPDVRSVVVQDAMGHVLARLARPDMPACRCWGTTRASGMTRPPTVTCWSSL